MLKGAGIDLNAADALEFMRKVANGEEESQDTPLIMPKGGTCYAFFSAADTSKRNDWRADGYRWQNNGRSHIKVGDKVVRRTYFNVFTAPKVSSSNFRRVSHHCSDYPDIVIMYYSGDHAIAGCFPHGNRKNDSRPFVRTCPSIMAACRNSDGEPSTIFNKLATASNKSDSMIASMITSPRDASQISNQKKYARRKLKRAQEIMNEMQVSNQKFTFEVESSPVLIVSAFQEERMKMFNAFLGMIPVADEQYLSSSPAFIFESFTISSLVYRYSTDSPILLFLFLIHDYETVPTDETIWEIACHKIPKLCDARNVTILTKQEAFQMTEPIPLVPSETFSDIVSCLEKFKDSPCDAVCELQENAAKLYGLSLYYDGTSLEGKGRRKRPVHNNYIGMFDLIDNDDIKLKCKPITRSERLDEKSDNNSCVPSCESNDESSHVENADVKTVLGITGIHYIAESGSFVVAGENDVRIVNLFPKETCTCLSSTRCSHILACKYFIGQPLSKQSSTTTTQIDNKENRNHLDASSSRSSRYSHINLKRKAKNIENKISKKRDEIVVEIAQDLSGVQQEFETIEIETLSASQSREGYMDSEVFEVFKTGNIESLENQQTPSESEEELDSLPPFITRFSGPQHEMCKTMGIGNCLFSDCNIDSLHGSKHMNDKVIMAYLAYLQKRNLSCEDNRMLVLPPSFAAKLKRNKFDWLYKKVRFESFRWIFIPVCRWKQWILLAVEIPSRLVLVIDSIGTKWAASYCSLWRKYMECRCKIVESTLNVWEEMVLNLKTTDYKSDRNCDVTLLMNAEALLSNVKPGQMKTGQVEPYKQHIKRCLLGSFRFKELLCDSSKCVLGEQKKLRVFCDNCFMWYHNECDPITKDKNIILLLIFVQT